METNSQQSRRVRSLQLSCMRHTVVNARDMHKKVTAGNRGDTTCWISSPGRLPEGKRLSQNGVFEVWRWKTSSQAEDYVWTKAWKIGYLRLFPLSNASLPSKTISKLGQASECSGGLNRNFWEFPPEMQIFEQTIFPFTPQGILMSRTQVGFHLIGEKGQALGLHRHQIRHLLPNHFVILGNMLDCYYSHIPCF